MDNWDPAAYDRHRHIRLLAAIHLALGVRRQVDPRKIKEILNVGSGNGNEEPYLLKHFPVSDLTGIDSSLAMTSAALARADRRAQYVHADFVQAPGSAFGKPNLIYASNSLHLMPNQAEILLRIADMLARHGVFAANLPDHWHEPLYIALRDVLNLPQWRHLKGRGLEPSSVLPLSAYLRRLGRAGFKSHVFAWRTRYEFVMNGPEDILDFMMGSILPRYLQHLVPAERMAFLADVLKSLSRFWPPHRKARLGIPRIFLGGILS